MSVKLLDVNASKIARHACTHIQAQHCLLQATYTDNKRQNTNNQHCTWTHKICSGTDQCNGTLV